MRNLKKILALVLALVMTLSVMATANAAFSDEAAIDAGYAEAIEVLSGLKVFQGENGAFKPDANITRQEFAAILYRIISGDVADAQKNLYVEGAKFADVASTSWAAGYIGYCANGNYIKGYDGKFDPTGNVTGYQALAMILRAVGYDKNGEFTGSDWEKNVATTAQQIGMLNGVAASVNLRKAVSREVVAQILFNGILADKVEYTPAFGYQATKVNYAASAIASDMFGLVKGARTEIDNWGRPGYQWFAKGVAIATIEEKALVSYTTKATECDIFAAAKFTGLTKDALICWVNGAKLAQTYSIQATDVYTKLGAQGRLTEVYADRIVMIDTLLAKVENVTKIGYDAAGHRINTSDLTLTVYDNVGTDTIVLSKTTDWTYSKGQYVLVNVETATAGDLFAENHLNAVATDAVVLGVADSFIGAQTVIHYRDGMHTIDGVDYFDASCFHKDDAVISNAKYTWFKDQYGNIIGSALIPTAYDFGVIKNIQWFTQAGVYGYAHATMVMMDGSEKSLTIAAIADADDTAATALTYALDGTANLDAGTVSTEIQANYAQYAGTDLYRIQDNGNGTYTLVNVANTMVDVAPVSASGDVETPVVATSHVMGDTLVDTNTKYLVRKVTALDAAANYLTSYSAVVGFNAIGSFSNAKIDYVDLNNDGRADYVYIIGIPADANTAGLFYRSSVTTSYYVPVVGGGNYYVLNGYVNGELSTIKTTDKALHDAIIAADADTLFDIKVVNGYVTAAVEIGNTDTLLHNANVGPYTGKYATSCEGFDLYYAADALTLKGYTSGWNVTKATRVIGTLVEGATYATANYTVHVVFDKTTMNAIEIYVFQKTAGGSNSMDPSTAGEWVDATVSGYQFNSVLEKGLCKTPYTTTLSDMAAAFAGEGYALTVDGLVIPTSGNVITIAQALADGYALKLVNTTDNTDMWTIVLAK